MCSDACVFPFSFFFSLCVCFIFIYVYMHVSVSPQTHRSVSSTEEHKALEKCTRKALLSVLWARSQKIRLIPNLEPGRFDVFTSWVEHSSDVCNLDRSGHLFLCFCFVLLRCGAFMCSASEEIPKYGRYITVIKPYILNNILNSFWARGICFWVFVLILGFAAVVFWCWNKV